jgi:hypothetical protein
VHKIVIFEEKMMTRVILLFLLLPFLTVAQRADDHVMLLKEGALFVRLKTSETTIEALRGAGKYEEAEMVDERQKEKNREIVDAFTRAYDFSEIYFFKSRYSKDVRNRNWDGVLLDTSLQPVADPPPIHVNFYIAEFWHIERSDEGTFQGYAYKLDTTGYQSKQKVYSGDTELGPYALIIRGPDFMQLDRPFPFFVRTYEGFPVIRRKKVKVVDKMNQKLHNYYKKVK